MWHKIPSLVSEALAGINTDLTPDALLSLAMFANEIPTNRIELYMAPGRDATIEGLSYWLVDLPALQKKIIETGVELEAPQDMALDFGWRR